MRADGTLPRAFLETDPGRLELLGVRWVQVPTAALAVPADEDGLGDRLDVRPRAASAQAVLALPFTRATEVRIASFLSGATEVPQGEIVAECVARLASGREIWLPIRAGVDTAEWAWERPDVRESVRHERAPILASFPVREGFDGPPVPRRPAAAGALRGRWACASAPGPAPRRSRLLRAGLRDAEHRPGPGGRGSPRPT